MPAKRSTSLWAETTPITKDVAKEGQIAHVISGWECDHCKAQSWSKDVSRLMFHLSGDVRLRRLRDADNGFTGIDVCTHVPDGVADRAKSEMMAKAAKKARKLSSSAAGKVMVSEEKATCALKGYRARSHT